MILTFSRTFEANYEFVHVIENSHLVFALHPAVMQNTISMNMRIINLMIVLIAVQSQILEN